MATKKSSTKKTTKKSSAKKPASKKTGEALRKEALAEVEQNIARIDGEALAEASRANRRKAAAAKGTSKKPRMSKDAARAEGAAKTKAALAEKKPPKAKPTKAPKEKRASGLDLAAKVLAESKEPLNSKTIADRAVAAGWKTSGKTPHATLYAAMIREIAAKGKDARFQKTDRGLFAATSAGKKGA